MRHFILQNNRGGKFCAFNQNYQAKNSDKTYSLISEELNVKGNKYEILEKKIHHKNENIVKRRT